MEFADRVRPGGGKTVTACTPIRPLFLAASVFGAALAAPCPMRAATPSEVRSLRALPGVEVVVENPSQELIGLGLNTEQARAEIQARLQERGVHILAEGDRPPGRPWLYFRMFAVKTEGVATLAYFVTAQLRQDVSLDRNPDSHLGASTWDASAGGLASAETIAATVRAAAQDLADTFLTDYLTANARH